MQIMNELKKNTIRKPDEMDNSDWISSLTQELPISEMLEILEISNL